MSNRKNYNSIVFLTVYLGLVLVGASPQVLAQAAMTRPFDVKTEIEFKDDLDDKPDKNDSSAGAVADFVEGLSALSQDNSLRREKAAGREETTAAAVARRSFAEKAGSAAKRASDDDAERFALGSQIFSVNPPDKSLREKGSDLRPFLSALGGQFTQFVSASNPAQEKTVAENTSVSSENNQVFIVTRLPRASIDALLADKIAR